MTYDDHVLQTTAARSTCMADFLAQLGVQATPGRRRHLWHRLREAGVDLGHWSRSPRQWYSSDELAAAVAASTSFAGVLRHLGIPQAGGSHAYLARRIRAEGFDTTHFLGQAHKRGTAGSNRAQARDVLVLRPAGSARVKTSILRRLMQEAGVPHRCGRCGLEPLWRDQPLTLVIDHVNGDWLDNRLPNLRFLCPNCHAQTATWCRKKGP